MTKIEEVARAIYDSTYRALSQEERDSDWEDMKATFMPEANAAIEAMREPNEAMLEAVLGIDHIDRDPRYYWPRMINAALGK